MAQDWTKFSAFNGTVTDDFFKNADIDSAVTRFSIWLQDLTKQPANYGIPTALIPAVQLVLQTFFVKSSDGTRLVPLRISSKPQSPGKPGQIVIDPVIVPFGSTGANLPIADAPAALGYVFSVVTPTSIDGKPPNWMNYYLPLTVVYSWSIYLAFIKPDEFFYPCLTNVPEVACVMYESTSTALPVFALGSTWAFEPSAAGQMANADTQQPVLDKWNLSALLVPALATLDSSIEPLPYLDTFFRSQAAKRLFRYFLGLQKRYQDTFGMRVLDKVVSPSPSLEDFLTAQAVSIVATDKEAGTLLPVWQLISDDRFSDKIFASLYGLVDIRFNPGYNPLDPTTISNLNNFWSQLATICLTPHIFSPASLELPIPSTNAGVIEGLVVDLCSGFAKDLMVKLDSVFDACRNYGPPDQWMTSVRPWGRCAETYGAVLLKPNYFKELAPATEMLPSVRGIDLQIRNLGLAVQGGVFNSGFTSTALDQASVIVGESVYRYPCTNCDLMLEKYLYQTDMDGFNQDVNAVQPKSVPVVT